ncbi:MAG: MFS transporter [Nocardioides sp.]
MILRTSRDFRWLWAGQSTSVVGDGMQRVALLWWASHAGGNALLVAVALCAIVPVVACSPFGGALADRHDRRRLLLLADLLRLLTTTMLAALVSAGSTSGTSICALVAVSALGTAIFDPAYAAAVPSVVPHEDRPQANGLNLANSAVGGLVGPLIGGLLIGAFGVEWVLAIDAATFAWSLCCIWATKLPLPDGGSAGTRTTGRAVLTDVLADREIRGLLGLAATLNMVAAPVPILIVALAVDKFRVGAESFGVLQAMISAGILVGALAGSRLATGSVAPPMFALGMCLCVVGMVPYAASAASLLIAGVAIAVANTTLMTTFQSSVPSERHGRVFGVAGSIAEGLRPVGLVLSAPMLGLGGVTWAFVLVGSCVIAVTAVWRGSRRRTRPQRHLDSATTAD